MLVPTLPNSPPWEIALILTPKSRTLHSSPSLVYKTAPIIVDTLSEVFDHILHLLQLLLDVGILGVDLAPLLEHILLVVHLLDGHLSLIGPVGRRALPTIPILRSPSSKKVGRALEVSLLLLLGLQHILEHVSLLLDLIEHTLLLPQLVHEFQVRPSIKPICSLTYHLILGALAPYQRTG